MVIELMYSNYKKKKKFSLSTIKASRVATLYLGLGTPASRYVTTNQKASTVPTTASIF